MAKKKANSQDGTQRNNSPKEKFVLSSNVFHHDVITPLERKYRLAMRMKNYEEASRLYKELNAAHQEHRVLLHRKEHVKV